MHGKGAFSSRPVCALFHTLSEWPSYSIPIFLSYPHWLDLPGFGSVRESLWLVNVKSTSFKPGEFDKSFLLHTVRSSAQWFTLRLNLFCSACTPQNIRQVTCAAAAGSDNPPFQHFSSPECSLFYLIQNVFSLGSFSPGSPEVLSRIFDPNQMHFFTERWGQRVRGTLPVVDS